ncbi:MAG: hypothetical protein ACK46G_10715 [Flavobacteriales bacterium]
MARRCYDLEGFIAGNDPLANPHYRIVGSLLDVAMMRDWLMGRDLDTLR